MNQKSFITTLCLILTICFAPLHAVSDTFVDYQNFNRGYCPECNCFPCRCNASAVAEEIGIDEDEVPPIGPYATGAPPPPVPAPPCAPATPCAAAPAPCAPAPCKKPDPCTPAPICATNCGISLCWIGIGIVVIATAAAIIVSTNNGSTPSH